MKRKEAGINHGLVLLELKVERRRESVKVAVRGRQFSASSRQLCVCASAHASSGQVMDVRLASIEKATVLPLSQKQSVLCCVCGQSSVFPLR